MPEQVLLPQVQFSNPTFVRVSFKHVCGKTGVAKASWKRAQTLSWTESEHWTNLLERRLFLFTRKLLCQPFRRTSFILDVFIPVAPVQSEFAFLGALLDFLRWRRFSFGLDPQQDRRSCATLQVICFSPHQCLDVCLCRQICMIEESWSNAHWADSNNQLAPLCLSCSFFAARPLLIPDFSFFSVPRIERNDSMRRPKMELQSFCHVYTLTLGTYSQYIASGACSVLLMITLPVSLRASFNHLRFMYCWTMDHCVHHGNICGSTIGETFIAVGNVKRFWKLHFVHVEQFWSISG